MSGISDAEIMGGIGWGDDQYSYYDYENDLGPLVNHGRRASDPYNQMINHEDIGYIAGNPSIWDKGESSLDNSKVVEKYLLRRLPAANMPASAHQAAEYDKQHPLYPPRNKAPERFAGERMKGTMEKLEDATSQMLGPNTLSMFLSFIFIIVVVMAILQIVHTRRIYKLMKTVLKYMPRTVIVAEPKQTQV